MVAASFSGDAERVARTGPRPTCLPPGVQARQGVIATLRALVSAARPKVS
jgi:hypothetical protein